MFSLIHNNNKLIISCNGFLTASVFFSQFHIVNSVGSTEPIMKNPNFYTIPMNQDLAGDIVMEQLAKQLLLVTNMKNFKCQRYLHFLKTTSNEIGNIFLIFHLSILG